MNVLAKLLQEPELAFVAMDSSARIETHRSIIGRKRLTRSVFSEIQELMLGLEQRFAGGTGLRVEIGAGSWPLRERDPDVLATDVVDAPHLDRLLDAQSMDLPDASVRAFFGQHVFHHIPEPRKFLSEASRTLTSQGVIVLVEPYWSPIARLVFKNLFTTESYDPSQNAWETPAGTAMTNANQALSYVVFERDRRMFDEEFGNLRIVWHEPLQNWMRYLLSGGVNFRQLVPGFADRPLKALERAARPLGRLCALHHVLVIAKH